MQSKNIHLIGIHNNYMIGTPSPIIYNKIRQNIGNVSKLHVKRSITYNVSEEVNVGLKEFNIMKDYKNIFIDTNAELELIKMYPTTVDKLEIIDSMDFIMYPFQNNLSIMMATDILSENEYKIMFGVSIIEAVDDYEMFKKILKI